MDAKKGEVHKLTVLGDGGVGKTALTIQLCLNHYVETYDPTIEDSYRKQVVIDNRPCLLEVLDTAGQEEYTSLRDQWIREGQGFLLVYSVTSRATFERIERFKSQITRIKESETVPIILVGNKSDRTTDREVSAADGQSLARKLNCEWIECSAKTATNVENAFYAVVRVIRQQKEGKIGKPGGGGGGGGGGKAGKTAKSKKEKKKGCLIM